MSNLKTKADKTPSVGSLGSLSAKFPNPNEYQKDWSPPRASTPASKNGHSGSGPTSYSTSKDQGHAGRGSGALRAASPKGKVSNSDGGKLPW